MSSGVFADANAEPTRKLALHCAFSIRGCRNWEMSHCLWLVRHSADFLTGSGRAAANTPELMLNDNPSLSVSCTDVTRKAWDGKFLHWGHKPKTKPEILILLHSIQRVIGWNSILYFFFLLPVFNSYILCSESCSRICFLDRICHILISILACCLYIRNSTVTCFFCLFLGIKLLWKSFKQLQLEAFPRWRGRKVSRCSDGSMSYMY